MTQCSKIKIYLIFLSKKKNYFKFSLDYPDDAKTYLSNPTFFSRLTKDHDKIYGIIKKNVEKKRNN